MATNIPPNPPEGYNPDIPSLRDVKSGSEASSMMGFPCFSDEAQGYIIDLIETWCARNDIAAGQELRFVAEQAKWAVGWKAFGRMLIDQLPSRR